MRSILLTICTAILVLVAFGAIDTADACYIYNASGTCNEDDCIDLTWSENLDGCSRIAMDIYRRCGTSGSWTLIVQNHDNSPYEDCGPFPGTCLAGWYYKLVLKCTCSGEPVQDIEIVGPVYCP